MYTRAVEALGKGMCFNISLTFLAGGLLRFRANQSVVILHLRILYPMQIMLATLMCIYLMSFANVLYFDRPSGFQSVPTGSSSRGESRDDSKKAPVRVAENNTSAGGNTSQNLQETASHQSTGTTNVNSEGGSNNEGGSNPLGSGAANPRSREMKESSSSDSHSSDTNQPSKELAKHPMNRNMEDLQVPGNVGALSSDAVKDYYRKLAKAYLTTFTGGIHRQMYFDILRRRTYALTPPGANKGVQTILFQVIDKKVYMMDPYEVPRNSKPFYRTRINQVIWLLSKLCHEGRIKNTEFIMAIHDCVQTVNKPHTYRGAHYEESNPAFTIVSCNFSDNVPFPMWEGTKHRDGGFQGWDENMKKYAEDDIPWKQKQDRAVFRGGNRPSMYFKNKTDADSRCHDVGRTRLLFLSQQQPDVLDVSIGGSCGGKHESLHRMDARAQHKFKYILYAEGNCMWADRSKQHVFGPSAMIKQETPCGQFFEPLLRPNTHYIPTDFFFTDTIDKIKWARQNDEIAHQIVKNANEFASNFLSLKGIETYVEVLLEEYTALLVEPDVKLENGAIDVTDKEV